MEMVQTRKQSQKENEEQETYQDSIEDREEMNELHPVEYSTESRNNYPGPQVRDPSHCNYDRTQEIAKSVQQMETKVNSLESTLKTVTDQLTSAIEHLSSQARDSNLNQNHRPRSPYSRQDHSRHQSQRRNRYENESDTDDDSMQQSSPSIGTHQYRSRTRPKLPPFNGRESWKVWYNRFEEVANRQKWSFDEKLDELLPRLQGNAGDFVFGQLNQETRSNYSALCKELNNRFRVIETSKSFRIQFSNRNQRSGETPEQYAAELKMLYDKAHNHRDKATRQDDLLRRFLDGLADEKTRFYVEFVKEPLSIDEAVYQVICFQETKTRSRDLDDSCSRQAQCQHSDDETSVARSVPTKNKHKIIKEEPKENACPQINDIEKIREIIRSELNTLSKPQTQPQSTFAPKQYYKPYINYKNSSRPYNHNNAGNKRSCFQCGDPTHFKKDCPQLNAKSNTWYPESAIQPLNYNGLTKVANSQS